jgi:MFS transporter
MGRAASRTTLRSALEVREFRAMWAAEALSQAGDQLARVALSVLVYERTSSAGLTGLAYGLTYLPTLIGGTLLARLADRYPRRLVMVISDLLRAVAAGLMAIPGMPFLALCALLIVLTVAGGPFRAAQLAMLPAVLGDGERYLAGLAVRNITIQSAQVAGFAGGGFAIAVVGPYWGLALDALTFVCSAGLVWLGVTHRAAPGNRRSGLAVAARSMWAVPGLPALFGLKMLAGLYVTPEGLAAPYADQLGVATFAIGLLLASDPIGSVLGAWAYSRWVPADLKPRLVGWLAVGSGVPLAFLAMRPDLALSMVLIACGGLLSTPYQMQASAMMTLAVPDSVRGQVSGLNSTALVTVQGVGIMAAGAVAQVVGAATTLGLAALIGVGLAVLGAVAWARAGSGQSTRGYVP